MTASNVVSTTASAAGASSAAAMLVLGIPLGALAAALIGAGLSYVARPREPDQMIPARLLGIISDALIGGWLAVGLIHVTLLHRYGIDLIPIEAIAGLLAIFWRALRIWIPKKADQAWDTFLSFWARGRGGGGAS